MDKGTSNESLLVDRVRVVNMFSAEVQVSEAPGGWTDAQCF